MICPFCEAEQPELISLFGSQLLFSQYRCRACGTYFEGLRADAANPGESGLESALSGASRAEADLQSALEPDQ